VTHGATIAETRLDGLTVTVELTHTERSEELWTFGPLGRIDIVTSDGTRTDLDLTPVQVRMLARILAVEEGAKYLAEALAIAHTALEESRD
jgi:hypothetical protein